jgi:hypothetical protein
VGSVSQPPSYVSNADTVDGKHASDFALSTQGVTNGNAHDHIGGDGNPIKVGALSSEAQAAGKVPVSDGAGGVAWGDQAASGVTSVNGDSGPAVVLDTSDIADTTNKRYVTDAQLVTIGNQSGVNTGDQDLSPYALQSTLTTHTSDRMHHPSDDTLVHNVSAELVYGVKTFDSSPVVPTPSGGTDAANKAYVDAHAISDLIARYWIQNPDELREYMTEMILQGTLGTGNATEAQVTRTFGNATGDSNGIATWSGIWASNTGYRTATNQGDYVEIVIRTWGTHDIVMHRVAVAGGSPTVTLDGVSQTSWSQGANESYTLSGVAAGIHTIRVTCPAVGGMSIGSIVYYTLPYQGKGKAGDVMRIISMPRELIVTSIGLGNTIGAGTYNPAIYGESIIHRLPMGTGLTDADFARASCAIAGWTLGGTNALLRVPILGHRAVSTIYRGFVRPGHTLSLNGAAGTRGRQFDAGIESESYGPSMGASVYRLCILPVIGEITAVATGSDFVVGDIAFGLITDSALAAAVSTRVILANSNICAADFFKIPAARP